MSNINQPSGARPVGDPLASPYLVSRAVPNSSTAAVQASAGLGAAASANLGGVPALPVHHRALVLANLGQPRSLSRPARPATQIHSASSAFTVKTASRPAISQVSAVTSPAPSSITHALVAASGSTPNPASATSPASAFTRSPVRAPSSGKPAKERLEVWVHPDRRGRIEITNVLKERILALEAQVATLKSQLDGLVADKTELEQQALIRESRFRSEVALVETERNRLVTKTAELEASNLALRAANAGLEDEAAGLRCGTALLSGSAALSEDEAATLRSGTALPSGSAASSDSQASSAVVDAQVALGKSYSHRAVVGPNTPSFASTGLYTVRHARHADAGPGGVVKYEIHDNSAPPSNDRSGPSSASTPDSNALGLFYASVYEGEALTAVVSHQHGVRPGSAGPFNTKPTRQPASPESPPAEQHATAPRWLPPLLGSPRWVAPSTSFPQYQRARSLARRLDAPDMFGRDREVMLHMLKRYAPGAQEAPFLAFVNERCIDRCAALEELGDMLIDQQSRVIQLREESLRCQTKLLLDSERSVLVAERLVKSNQDLRRAQRRLASCTCAASHDIATSTAPSSEEDSSVRTRTRMDMLVDAFNLASERLVKTVAYIQEAGLLSAAVGSALPLLPEGVGLQPYTVQSTPGRRGALELPTASSAASSSAFALVDEELEEMLLRTIRHIEDKELPSAMVLSVEQMQSRLVSHAYARSAGSALMRPPPLPETNLCPAVSDRKRPRQD
ncbi:hypothetical protein OC835_002079 [Tilletia horrida]|nr:hypothetical protein OC835_002079 [Tilletia horrida]